MFWVTLSTVLTMEKCEKPLGSWSRSMESWSGLVSCHEYMTLSLSLSPLILSFNDAVKFYKFTDWIVEIRVFGKSTQHALRWSLSLALFLLLLLDPVLLFFSFSFSSLYPNPPIACCQSTNPESKVLLMLFLLFFQFIVVMSALSLRLLSNQTSQTEEKYNSRNDQN